MYANLCTSHVYRSAMLHCKLHVYTYIGCMYTHIHDMAKEMLIDFHKSTSFSTGTPGVSEGQVGWDLWYNNII